MKDNQPELKEAIAAAFDPPGGPVACSAHERRVLSAHRQTAAASDKGHGRVEHRRLTASTELSAYLDWPHVGQVLKIERHRALKGKATTEIAYGITSLKPAAADARRLLELTRGHWGIENRSFYVRDVTMGEDACRVRSGPAPQALAALRNASLALLNLQGSTNKAAALRRYAAHPQEALALIRDPPPEN